MKEVEQFWWQLRPIHVSSQLSGRVRESGGTVSDLRLCTHMDVYERAPLGLAVWGSGVRVPSAPRVKSQVRDMITRSWP